MKHAALFFAALMLSALSCSAVRGQGCGLSMVPEYSAYSTSAIESTTIYTYVTVQGYAVIYPSAGCTLQGVTHQGRVYNMTSTTGGWVDGPATCPSCFISVSNNQSFTGTPGATYPYTWEGEIYCSKDGVFYSDGASSNVADVSAVISQITSGTLAGKEAAQQNYQKAEGTLNLGQIIGSGAVPGCFLGNQGIGTITPSTYTGTVTIRRTIVLDATFTNSTQKGGGTGQDDTAVPALRNDSPQSGASKGTVYDLDAPGPAPSSVDGNTYRYRGHHYIYATLPSGTEISTSEYDFYVAISCTKTASGYQFVSDVPGDNQISTSPIKLTWNLQ